MLSIYAIYLQHWIKSIDKKIIEKQKRGWGQHSSVVSIFFFAFRQSCPRFGSQLPSFLFWKNRQNLEEDPNLGQLCLKEKNMLCCPILIAIECNSFWCNLNNNFWWAKHETNLNYVLHQVTMNVSETMLRSFSIILTNSFFV